MNHTQLLQEFKDWLLLLGYAKTTVYKLPKLIQDLLLTTNIKDINELHRTHINNYYKHLQTRTNKRFGGGLANKTLNQYQWAFKLFCSYLQKYYQLDISLQFKAEKVTHNIPDFLSVEEVKELFEATKLLENTFQQRYKATLVLLYNCGLRRSEASKLNVQDISYGNRILQVTRGKNNKQRFVPFNSFSAEILRNYQLDARMELNTLASNGFLLGNRGTRLTEGTIGNNIKKLVELTNNKDLQTKKVTAHTLRHSIATHLLEKEMDIEAIQLFLGHSSLESTQIYTHITEDDTF